MRITHIFYIILLLLAACGSPEKPVVEKIDLRLEKQGELINGKTFSLDYTNSMDSGFVFPSTTQASDGKLKVDIHVNQLDPEKKYFYKVYYQNESYKFDELADSSLSAENFYGSWKNTSVEFIEIDKSISSAGKGIISTNLELAGNPRDEKQFYDFPTFMLDETSIPSKIEAIKRDEKWFNDVKAKAKTNKNAVDQQLYLDAVYALEMDFNATSKNKKINMRHRRNLRVGNYSVMVVIVNEEELQKIPATVKNIGKTAKDGFLNPYRYFAGQADSASKRKEETAFTQYKLDNAFKLTASVDLGKGIFMQDEIIEKNYTRQYFSATCAKTFALHKNAQIEQFFHSVDKNVTLNNIPLVADIMENYSKKDFETNAAKYDSLSRVRVPLAISDCPCKTVKTDTANRTISIINPASPKNKNQMRKENVGVNTRHPLCYGKYTVKIKMAEQMNKDNVWNGLTNAIWLIHKGKPETNQRRICASGFIPKNVDGKNAPRQKSNHYSEIDFEIVKCAQYWPKSSYKNPKDYKKEDIMNEGNVMVTCTNWDLACSSVNDYVVGAAMKKMGKNTYEMHRWDTWYKALTIKTPANEDELFAGNFYYFQIDWQPKEIIWRIGKSKENLKEVARMDYTVTNIPNNQMVLAITQEYHLAQWWPESPFSQDNVPFPAKDFEGTIFSIEIE